MLRKISRVFGRRARNEREALLAALRSLGEGKMETRLNLPSASPLAGLAAAFNEMAANLAAASAAQRELTGAVCHELRHPLMRLRFRHAMVRDSAARNSRTSASNRSTRMSRRSPSDGRA